LGALFFADGRVKDTSAKKGVDGSRLGNDVMRCGRREHLRDQRRSARDSWKMNPLGRKPDFSRANCPSNSMGVSRLKGKFDGWAMTRSMVCAKNGSEERIGPTRHQSTTGADFRHTTRTGIQLSNEDTLNPEPQPVSTFRLQRA
jgi:hypothetical protein